jgi:hypothetical protein
MSSLEENKFPCSTSEAPFNLSSAGEKPNVITSSVGEMSSARSTVRDVPPLLHILAEGLDVQLSGDVDKIFESFLSASSVETTSAPDVSPLLPIQAKGLDVQLTEDVDKVFGSFLSASHEPPCLQLEEEEEVDTDYSSSSEVPSISILDGQGWNS